MEGIHRPKVAIVTPGTFTVPSNASSSVERVVDALSRRLQDELKFYIFSKRSKGFVRYEQIMKVTHIRPKSSRASNYEAAVHRSVNKIRPKLIQVENRPIKVIRMKRRHSRTPVWLSLHSVTFLDNATKQKSLIRRGLSLASYIIVNSEFLKEEVIRRFPFCAGKILVNHLGTDEQIFASQWLPEAQQDRERLRLTMGLANRKIVVYAGRLIRIKGVHHVLNVWGEVIKQYPDAILIIIGSAFYGSSRVTPYVERLHRLGNRFKQHVRFIPYTPYSHMPKWFRIADIAVVPSIGQEAFGLVNVEAMASGVPVLAGNAGGIHEVVAHGSSGYLLELDSIETDLKLRLCELLGDDSKRRQMGLHGAQIVSERFTWEKVAERQLELYRRYAHIF